ncbi:MAG: DEAD/DEAH box helicase [Sandaracinaceae bacterium]|nr:DEAD/DEAH box helicase [Sandaracinaceae bacterium]
MNDRAENDSPPSFDSLALTDEVRRAIDELGFVEPTPVQVATYGPAVRGADLVVQARTGTGKTAAFGIPLVDRLVRPDGGAQVLILAPTRELALQSAREIGRIGTHKGIRTAAVYGGAPMERQVRELQEGAQIVSGTPGRVLDHLKRGTLDANGIRILILDEADEMLSMGFAKELNAIVALLPTKRQTMLFSATIDDAVERMSQRMLKDPERVSLSSDAVGAQGVTHYYYLVSGVGRTRELVRILEIEDPETAIIFCNTRAATEQVAQELKQAGFNADWLNADLPQSERENVLGRTRRGELRYLVATDVAARGIDISHLTHVVNYDFPAHVEGYVHRTGRTGRAGRTGTAISLVSPPELGSLYYLRLSYKIFPIERSLPTEGELRTRQETDRIALLSAAFPDQPGELDRAVARRLLTHPDAERLLAGLMRAFFGVAQDVDESAAAARRDRRARPAPAPRPEPRSEARPEPRSEPRSEPAPQPERVAAAPSRAAEEAREDDERERVDDEEGDEDAVFLYVNVGRRDGVRPGEIIRLLAEECSLDKSEVGRIRIRDRHTFVGVPREKADSIVTQLQGKSALDKELVVERARAQP